ncbi:MAG: 1-acyl-sn-glycerol-3-phosphate acyltransferase [Bacteroidales bacterium]|nr:1-acyl-sn-glycerol-3-phosphate acyltransferase [Bacteroidales bacterium]
MLQRLSHWLLFRVMGWRAEVTQPMHDKAILCVAPHTSNQDFFVGILYYWSIGRRARFLMKKDWFFWPLGGVLRALGGVPVYRDAKHNLTDQLAAMAASETHFELAITPEGSRSPRTEWKQGFYYVARKAGIPILLYGLDYGQKRIVCAKTLYAEHYTVEQAMAEVKAYFAPFVAKYPEKFVY